jgi:pilus assembly protein CpaB
VASLGIMQMRKGSTPDSLNGSGVFVATSDIGMGEALSAAVLRLEAWPTGKIPAGAISRIEDADGRRTRARLYPGEPILENMLFAKGMNSQGAAAMISKGFRVVPVKVDLVSGGSSLILPGDSVDVMIHLVRDPNRDIPETVTRTILQDIKVFAVNDVLNTERDKDNGKSITAKTISLLVTPDQAAKVMLASQLGVINLVMRSPEDDKSVSVAQARPSDLYGVPAKNTRAEDSPGENTPNLKSVAAKPLSATAVKLRETWTIRAIKPGVPIEDIVFEAEEGKSASAADKSWKIVSGGGTPTAKQEAKLPELSAKGQPLSSGEETPKKGTVREVAKGDVKN